MRMQCPSSPDEHTGSLGLELQTAVSPHIGPLEGQSVLLLLPQSHLPSSSLKEAYNKDVSKVDTCLHVKRVGLSMIICSRKVGIKSEVHRFNFKCRLAINCT